MRAQREPRVWPREDYVQQWLTEPQQAGPLLPFPASSEGLVFNPRSWGDVTQLHGRCGCDQAEAEAAVCGLERLSGLPQEVERRVLSV